MNKCSKIVLSIAVLLMTACAHRPGYYSSYPSSGGYYSNNYYGNSGYYQHNHNRPYYPSGNWGYGKPYPGGGYNSNNYYNNYYYDNDHKHNHGNDYVKDPSRPWVHGDNRYDKRLYRQPTRDDNHDGGWFGHHNDQDDNHSSNWNSWHHDNDRQRPEPQALPQHQPPSHNFTENHPQGGNFNFNGENPHGRPVRPSAVEEHVQIDRPQITPRPMPVEPIRVEQPVPIGGGHQRPERDVGEQPGNHMSHDRKHEGRGFGR